MRGFEKDTSRFLNTVTFLIVVQVRKCIKTELQDNLNALLNVKTCLSQIISNSNVNVKYSTFISPRETPRHKVQPNDTFIEGVSRGRCFSKHNTCKVEEYEMTLRNLQCHLLKIACSYILFVLLLKV